MDPKGTGDSYRFEGCVSTRLPGADRAGHWTVGVRDFVLPGSFAAQEFTDVQVFDTSCVALALDYQFSSQETTSHSRFTVETTQTISGYDGKPVNLTAAGPHVPRVVEASQGSHLLILVNSRYQLQRVACVDLPNPPPP